MRLEDLSLRIELKQYALHQQFTSVSTEDSTTNEPSVSWKHMPIRALEIATAGVKKILKNLREHKASGPDDLTSNLPKTLAEEIAPIMQLMFNLSLSQGTVPTDWRHARVTSLFKKSDPSKAEKYRSVSLA